MDFTVDDRKESDNYGKALSLQTLKALNLVLQNKDVILATVDVAKSNFFEILTATAKKLNIQKSTPF